MFHCFYSIFLFVFCCHCCTKLRRSNSRDEDAFLSYDDFHDKKYLIPVPTKTLSTTIKESSSNDYGSTSNIPGSQTSQPSSFVQHRIQSQNDTRTETPQQPRRGKIKPPLKTPSPLDRLTSFDKICAGILFYSAGEVLLTLRNSNFNDRTWDMSGGQIDADDFVCDDLDIPSKDKPSSTNGITFYDCLGNLGATARANHLSENDVYPYSSIPTLQCNQHRYGISSFTWKAALRECREELGLYGKTLQILKSIQINSIYNLYRSYGTKRYTLYLCIIDPQQKERFVPNLSEEHTAWGWFPVEFLSHLCTLPNFDIHPWLESFKDEYPDQWAQLVLDGRKYASQVLTNKKYSTYNDRQKVLLASASRPRHPQDAFLSYMQQLKQDIL